MSAPPLFDEKTAPPAYDPSAFVKPSVGTSLPVPSSVPNVSAWEQYCLSTEVRADVKNDLFNVLSNDTTVVLLLDDSGSMQTTVRPPGTSPFAVCNVTRWSELQGDVLSILQLVTTVNPKGVDVHFLNRQGAKGIMNSSQVAPMFVQPPSGSTPLIQAISNMCRDYRSTRGKVLLIVITDGEPSDGTYSELYNVLSSIPNNFYVSMVECNDNEEEMEYLTGWDLSLPRFHNQEDYGEELKLVQRVNGMNAKFTRANYVQMIVLSPICPKYAIDIRTAGGKRANPFCVGAAAAGGGFVGASYASTGQSNYYSPTYGTSSSNNDCCAIL